MFLSIVNRLLMLVPIVIGITIISFILLQIVPGDPAARAMGTRASAEELEAMRVLWGLDRPLWQQYLMFLRDVVTGSFGQSIFYRLPVSELVIERLPYTLGLVLYSTILAVLIAFPLAVVSALYEHRTADLAIKQLFVFVLATPSFWLSYLAILFFALYLDWFPTGGVGGGFFGSIYRLFLPALVLALSTAALIQQSLRSSLIQGMKADYVDTARAKGVPYRTVFRRHILRNSLISTISIIGVRTSWIIGGTVVVEKIFSIPGVGTLLIDSISARDLPVIRGLTVMFAILVVMINLLTDLAYAAADPRVEL